MQEKELNIKQADAEFTKIIIDGDMFKQFTGNGLYLSGNKYNSKLVDLYSNVKNLSSYYPPFSGIPIDNWEKINNEALEFYLPKNLPIGYYDIIFCNPAGYCKASDSLKFNFINIVETAFDSLKVVSRLNGQGYIVSFNNNLIIK